MKKDINQRFIQSVEYVISTKEVYNKSRIASELKISPSKFSEILNKRMNVGVDMVAVFCELFGISSEWMLTGKGEMTNENVMREENIQQTKNLQELIELQRKEIERLKNEIDGLKK
ncbi:hypothetical protein [Flavobacterium sp.]|uniref:helix-turn-helix domain-containing protein n=1 Tax=Flavobacterium sp. TaxID=239 RepID=UPI002603212E|nr:hypothetical protein [Flavobacterium sp.]